MLLATNAAPVVPFHRNPARWGGAWCKSWCRPSYRSVRGKFALVIALASAAVMLASPRVHAQPYPSKPLRMIVPFAAGAATDIGARNLATRLAELLGQPIVVDNRPGAGGNVATRMLVQAPADGYTIMAGGTGQIANMHLFGNPGYDLFKDLRLIATTTSATSILVVNGNAPYRTAQDLAAAARVQRDKLSYGSGGLGTSAHLSGATFVRLAKAESVHVPYKSAAEIVQGVLGGQVDFGVPILAVAHQHIKAGRLRALAVTIPTRHPLFPDVPTFAEAMPGDFSLTTWFGILVASGTPQAISDQLRTAIIRIQRTKDFQEATERDGSLVTITETQAALDAFVRKEYEMYKVLVAQSGAKVE